MSTTYLRLETAEAMSTVFFREILQLGEGTRQEALPNRPVDCSAQRESCQTNDIRIRGDRNSKFSAGLDD